MRIGTRVSCVYVCVCVCMCVCASSQKCNLQDCAGWTAVGIFILMLGPVGFFVLAGFRISHHIHTGDLRYEEAPRPTWAGLKSAVSEAKGCSAKIKAVQGFYGECIARGEWNADNPHARRWGFVLGDMSKFGFIYALFLIGKRVYVSGTLILTDGRPNALMSMVGQTSDSVLLLLLRPFNDAQVTTTEALAGIGNAGAYFALGLPVIMGPDFYLGDLHVLLISVFGVAISAVTSMLGTLSRLVEGASACVSGVTACTGGIALGVGLGGSELVAEAVGVVSEEAQGAAEEAMEGEEDEEAIDVDANVVGASAAGLAYGVARAINRDSHSAIDPPGLKWHAVGTERPDRGSEIHNDELAAALTHRSEFSAEELRSLHADKLSLSSYIKVGNTYVQPCLEAADADVADAKVADTTKANEELKDIEKRLEEREERTGMHFPAPPSVDFAFGDEVAMCFKACGCNGRQAANDSEDDQTESVRLIVVKRTQPKSLRGRAKLQPESLRDRAKLQGTTTHSTLASEIGPISETEPIPATVQPLLNPQSTSPEMPVPPDALSDTDPPKPPRLLRDPDPFIIAPTFPPTLRIQTIVHTDPTGDDDGSKVRTHLWTTPDEMHTDHMPLMRMRAPACMRICGHAWIVQD